MVTHAQLSRLTPAQPTKWLTVQQVEVVYNIPPRTQYKLINAGKLRSKTIGRRRLIEVASVEEL
jgi:excisionase family DNA binding protein